MRPTLRSGQQPRSFLRHRRRSTPRNTPINGAAYANVHRANAFVTELSLLRQCAKCQVLASNQKRLARTGRYPAIDRAMPRGDAYALDDLRCPFDSVAVGVQSPHSRKFDPHSACYRTGSTGVQSHYRTPKYPLEEGACDRIAGPDPAIIASGLLKSGTGA